MARPKDLGLEHTWRLRLRRQAIGRNYAQFAFMRSSIEAPLALGCRAVALLGIIRRASPRIETALTAL